MGMRSRWIATALCLAACSSGGDATEDDATSGQTGGSGASSNGGSGTTGQGGDAGVTDTFGNVDPVDALPDPDTLVMPMPNPDAFWEDDPPPMSCLEDGSMGPAPAPPGGTPECPDDKNREGCACPDVGATAACWPGLRANRNRGVCQDGETTCEPFGEFGGAWGPCEDYVLPLEDAVAGAEACRCFSMGRWELDSLSPCFITYPDGAIWAVSTFLDADGVSRCPDDPAGPPPKPQPGETWTANRLTVDCAGRFELCYTIKAGDRDDPQPDDCVLAHTCVEAWYEEADATQELPPLPSWSSPDSACAEAFKAEGGYGEMTVKGLSVECDPIDDGEGNEYVFNRVGYCPSICNDDPDLPECANCRQGGSGGF